MIITKDTTLVDILKVAFGEDYQKEIGNFPREIQGVSFRLMRR